MKSDTLIVEASRLVLGSSDYRKTLSDLLGAMVKKALESDDAETAYACAAGIAALDQIASHKF